MSYAELPSEERFLTVMLVSVHRSFKALFAKLLRIIGAHHLAMRRGACQAAALPETIQGMTAGPRPSC